MTELHQYFDRAKNTLKQPFTPLRHWGTSSTLVAVILVRLALRASFIQCCHPFLSLLLAFTLRTGTQQVTPINSMTPRRTSITYLRALVGTMKQNLRLFSTTFCATPTLHWNNRVQTRYLNDAIDETQLDAVNHMRLRKLRLGLPHR